jgi:hypothetical protein
MAPSSGLTTPPVGLGALLGPSEPNWAMRTRETRLVGLLNLSCLLSRTTFITDNDLSDNIHFLDGFRDDISGNIYRRVKDFVQMGFVRILLRDSLYGPNFEMPVHTFEDVYRSWLARDTRDAWIIKDFTEGRVSYFQDLDRWAGEHTLRYPYRPLKERFMTNLREVVDSSPNDPLTVQVRQLPPEIRREYQHLLERDWFSLTNVNELFQRRGMTIGHPAMHQHGMLNQQTFSDFARSSLMGADADDGELRKTESSGHIDKQLRTVELGEILDRADAILDGPSLAVLAQLRPEEIADLRSQGEQYFALLELSKNPEYAADSNHFFGTMLVRSATNYWAYVTDYIRTRYSYLSERPTQLSLFFGYDPVLPRAASNVFSLAVDAGLEVTAASIPGAKPAIEAAKGIKKSVKLRFLFLTPTDEYEKISRVLPRSFWFRNSRPQFAKHEQMDRPSE